MRLNIPLVVGNNQNGVSIEIRARQFFSNLRIYTNGVVLDIAFGFTNNALTFCVFIVDSQLSQLKPSGMRKTNQHNLLTIVEIWCVNFVLLNIRKRNKKMRRLPRHRSRL